MHFNLCDPALPRPHHASPACVIMFVNPGFSVSLFGELPIAESATYEITELMDSLFF